MKCTLQRYNKKEACVDEVKGNNKLHKFSTKQWP